MNTPNGYAVLARLWNIAETMQTASAWRPFIDRLGNRFMTSVRLGGTTFRRFVLALAMIALSMSSLMTTVVAQSSGASYEFEAGQTITWTDGWELDEESILIDGDVESILFTKSVSVLSVLSLPNDFDLNEARDIFLDAFLEAVGEASTIDRGSYGQVSYSLDLVNSEGFEYGVFTLFRAGSGDTPTFAYVFFSDVSEFATEFSDAQAAFLLDGEGLFDGVEGQGLQDLLEANAGSAAPPEPGEQSDGSDDPAADPDEDGTDLPEPDEPLDGSDDPVDEPGDDSGDEGLKGLGRGDDESQDDGDDAGTAGANEYVSPQYGVELVWGDSWQVNDARDEPILSDTTAGVDSIALASVPDGAFITISVLDAGAVTMSELLSVWVTSDFVQSVSLSSDAEVVLSDSSQDVGAMVVRDFLDDGTEIVSIHEGHLIGNVLVVINFTSFPGDASVQIEAAKDEIELDGEAVLEFFTIDEILAEFQ